MAAQFSGKLKPGSEFKDVEPIVLAIPGVSRFVQVFPDKDPKSPLFWWCVVYAEDDAVLPLLEKVDAFERVERSFPRYPCQ